MQQFWDNINLAVKALRAGVITNEEYLLVVEVNNKKIFYKKVSAKKEDQVYKIMIKILEA